MKMRLNQNIPQYYRFILQSSTAIAVIAGIFLSWGQSQAQDIGEIVDRLIAIVGDEVILESEVYQNAQSIALQSGDNVLSDPQEFQKLRENVLQEMINQKILLVKAREDSITVEDREVDRELENRLQMIIQNVGSEEKLEELYGYSIRRIRRDFRSTVEENLLVERVKYRFLQDIQVTRSEIEYYYQEHPENFPEMKDAVEIAHILRETDSAGLADTRALTTADSIHEALKNGAAFDSLAFQLSEDKSTAENFGQIGWTQRGDLVGDYEDAAYALEAGEISRPIKTRFGYHIIRVEDRREDRISTSHILIIPKSTEEDEQPVVELLNGLRDDIIAGLSFAEATQEYSQDLESAGREGYLGWFSLEEMPADFSEQIKDLSTGELSDPFKSQYGYHLIKVLNRREARPISLDQDWEQISKQVLSVKRDRAYNEWLEELKSRYYIEIKD
jgi:peptidyl-prolyl cis-trans isomerase SurA